MKRIEVIFLLASVSFFGNNCFAQDGVTSAPAHPVRDVERVHQSSSNTQNTATGAKKDKSTVRQPSNENASGSQKDFALPISKEEIARKRKEQRVLQLKENNDPQ